MIRRLIPVAVVAVVAMAAAAPLLAQTRQDKQADASEKAALAEHKAQEERERAAAAMLGREAAGDQGLVEGEDAGEVEGLAERIALVVRDATRREVHRAG